jgi:NAD(P)-dependent dehydrogenase (short-subunit alcohol dehydrogenase family)
VNTQELTGRVVVVTGSTQGLGEGIARRCAELHAAAVVITGRDEARGAGVARAIEKAGTRALFVRADLAVVDDCRTIIKAASDKFGRIDGLVNSAATTDRGTLDNTSVELWDRMMDLNVRAPFLLMQEAARVMKAGGRGGSIVNILSMSANGGQPFLTAYSSACAPIGFA